MYSTSLPTFSLLSEIVPLAWDLSSEPKIVRLLSSFLDEKNLIQECQYIISQVLQNKSSIPIKNGTITLYKNDIVILKNIIKDAIFERYGITHF